MKRNDYASEGVWEGNETRQPVQKAYNNWQRISEVIRTLEQLKMPNYGPSLALAVPVPEGATQITPLQWEAGMRSRLREMQKNYPPNLLADEWEDRTGEMLDLKDWGNLMDSIELRTRLMERQQLPEKPMEIDPEELVPDSEMLIDPIDLIAEIV